MPLSQSDPSLDYDGSWGDASVGWPSISFQTVLREKLSAAERERDAAFARGVEAAALEVERTAVAIPDNGPTWEKVTLATLANRIRALAPATDAGKETTT